MTAHWFIAPETVYSSRWKLAFPDAQVAVDAPLEFNANDLVWMLLQGAPSFIHIKQLSLRGIKVIAMTAVENSDEARYAIEAGAFGYTHYLSAAPLLQQIAQLVSAGGLWVGAELMRQLLFASANIIHSNKSDASSTHSLVSSVDPSPKSSSNLSSLSVREKAVADLVALGKSNKEIAIELTITERTVKAHLSAVFEKLKVRDRLQLVLMLAAKTTKNNF